MHLTTKWDAVFAIRFGAVNDLWQADFSQEARWRASLQQQASKAVGGQHEITGTAVFGGAYAKPVKAVRGTIWQQLTPAAPPKEVAVLQDSRVTYRIHEIVVLAVGTGYDQAVSSLSFKPSSGDEPLVAANFKYEHGLATVEFLPGPTYPSGTPIMFTSAPQLSFSDGSQAEVVLKRDGTGEVAYVRILKRGSNPTGASITLPNDPDNPDVLIKPVIGPYVQVVDGGQGYPAIGPTDAVVRSKNATAKGLRLLPLLSIDEVQFRSTSTTGTPIPDAMLPIIVVERAADDPETTDALVLAGRSATGAAAQLANSSYSKNDPRADITAWLGRSFLVGTTNTEGILCYAIDRVWQAADWSVNQQPKQKADAFNHLRSGIDSFKRGGTGSTSETLALWLGEVLSQAMNILWQYSDKFKAPRLLLAEQGKGESADPEAALAYARYVMRNEKTLNLASQKRELIEEAYAKVLQDEVALVQTRVAAAVRMAGTRGAYDMTQAGDLQQLPAAEWGARTMTQLAKGWQTNSLYRYNVLEVLLEAIGALVPTTCPHRIYSIGQLKTTPSGQDPVRGIESFSLELGSWRLIRPVSTKSTFIDPDTGEVLPNGAASTDQPTNSPTELTFRIPVQSGLLYTGRGTQRVLPTDGLAVDVTVSMRAVQKTQQFVTLEPSAFSVLRVVQPAAFAARLPDADLRNRLAAFLRRALLPIKPSDSVFYSVLNVASTPRANYSRVLARLNVLEDIATQARKKAATPDDHKKWLTPRSVQYYARNNRPDEQELAEDDPRRELLICILMSGDKEDSQAVGIGLDKIPPGRSAALLIDKQLLLRKFYLPAIARSFYLDETTTETADAQKHFRVVDSTVTTTVPLYFSKNFLTDSAPHNKADTARLRIEPGEFAFVLNARSVSLAFNHVKVPGSFGRVSGTASRNVVGQYLNTTARYGSANRTEIVYSEDSQQFIADINSAQNWVDNWINGVSVLGTVVMSAALATRAVGHLRVQQDWKGWGAFAAAGCTLIKTGLNFVFYRERARVEPANRNVAGHRQYGVGTYVRNSVSPNEPLVINQEIARENGQDQRYMLTDVRLEGAELIATVQQTPREGGNAVISEYALEQVPEGFTGRVIPRVREMQQQVNIVPAPDPAPAPAPAPVPAPLPPHSLISEGINTALLGSAMQLVSRANSVIDYTANALLVLNLILSVKQYIDERNTTSDKEKLFDAQVQNGFTTIAGAFLNDIRPFFGVALVVDDVRLDDGLVIGFNFNASQGALPLNGEVVLPRVRRDDDRNVRLKMEVSGSNHKRFTIRMQLAQPALGADKGYRLLGEQQTFLSTNRYNKQGDVAETFNMHDFYAPPEATMLVLTRVENEDGRETTTDEIQFTLKCYGTNDNS